MAREFKVLLSCRGLLPLAAVLLLFLYSPGAVSALAGGEPLYFKTVSEKEADALFEEALHLKKVGNIPLALEKYESAIISRRVLLAGDSAGLKDLLVEKYEKLSAAGKEIENYYKLAYLYDLTGELKKSEEFYSKALELAGTATIKQHISALLEGVRSDKKYYDGLNAQSAKLPEPEEPPPAAEPDGPKKAPGASGGIADKINESRKAEFADRLEEVDAKIAAAEKRLEEAGESERKAKNDWSGRANFKRDWRDTESSDPLVDQSDPYQNTYRRRYRQAKSAREEIEREIAALREDRKKIEEERKEFEAQSGDTATPQSEGGRPENGVETTPEGGVEAD